MNIQQLFNGITLGAVYALIAVGFALIFSILKFSNFSHGGVITVTAYAGYFYATQLSTNLFFTVLLSALTGGVIGLIIEFIGFRSLRNNDSPIIYYFVSSITLGILLENLITIFKGTTFYAFPDFAQKGTVKILGGNISTFDIVIFCISILSLLALLFVLKRTKLGLAIRAASMDITTCNLMGVNSNVVIASAFFIAGCLAGISGVFLGISYTLYPQLGKLVVKGFIASVIGGLGSLSGAVLGAFILGIIEVLLISFIGAGLSPVVIFVITLVFLIIRPEGIAGTIVSEKA